MPFRSSALRAPRHLVLHVIVFDVNSMSFRVAHPVLLNLISAFAAPFQGRYRRLGFLFSAFAVASDLRPGARAGSADGHAFAVLARRILDAFLSSPATVAVGASNSSSTIAAELPWTTACTVWSLICARHCLAPSLHGTARSPPLTVTVPIVLPGASQRRRRLAPPTLHASPDRRGKRPRLPSARLSAFPGRGYEPPFFMLAPIFRPPLPLQSSGLYASPPWPSPLIGISSIDASINRYAASWLPLSQGFSAHGWSCVQDFAQQP
jgi:hypothetical protein